MAYQVKRRRLVESLELVDETGKVTDTLTVDLDTTRMAMEFNRKYNAMIRAEMEISKLRKAGKIQDPCAEPEQAEQISTAMSAYGNAVIGLFELLFGDEQTEKLLTCYENRYSEMTLEVLPFVIEVVLPAMQRSLREQQERLAAQYQAKKRW